MLDVLRAAGVNNMDLYPIEILHPDGARASESDHYYVFNLLGVVEAKDLAKPQEYLMFRLAQMLSAFMFQLVKCDSIKYKFYQQREIRITLGFCNSII